MTNALETRKLIAYFHLVTSHSYLDRKAFFTQVLFEFDIISGGSGQTNFKSKRYLARGGQIKEGVTVLELQSNYTWRPVDKTNFIVGIVVAEGDKEEMLSSLTIPSGIYRRTDI